MLSRPGSTYPRIMDPVDVPRSVFPAPFRSLTRSIGGAEFTAVVALALHLMGVPVVDGMKYVAPSAWLSGGWIPRGWDSVALVAAVAFVAAIVGVMYVLGLVVDYWATDAWSWISRRGGKRDDDSSGSEERARDLTSRPVLKRWADNRSQYYLIEQAAQILVDRRLPDDLDNLPPWLRTQRRWWDSDNAASQLSDLQMRLSIAKMTAFNAALASLVAVVGLVWNHPGWVVSGGPAAATILAAAGMGMVLTHPGGTEGRCRPWWRTGITLAFVGGLVYLGWLRLCPAVDLGSPGPVEALSLTAVGGVYLAFGFAHVRTSTNALYHRIIRDAAGVDVIEVDGSDTG